MKNCSKIQEEILSANSSFSEEIEAHCAKCDNCRELKNDWAKLADAPLAPAVPISNDFAIIRAAQKHTKNQKNQILFRRIVGYAAAAVSGAAAIYTIIFNYQVPANNNIYQKSWDWDNFEEKAFVLDTAAEVSAQDFVVGSVDNEALNDFVENEIDIKTI